MLGVAPYFLSVHASPVVADVTGNFNFSSCVRYRAFARVNTMINVLAWPPRRVNPRTSESLGKTMLSTDRIKIQCPHCKIDFLQQAKRIRGGITIACANCKELIRFDDASPIDGIRKALSAARKVRRQASTSPF